MTPDTKPNPAVELTPPAESDRVELAPFPPRPEPLTPISIRDGLPRVRFALATREDDAAIRRLLRENPMPGAITLTFEREPHYFLGAGIGGAEDHTVLAFESDRLICAGRCTTRECWVNGRMQRVGYLAELRLDRTAAGRFDVLRGGYRFFRELHRGQPPALYFTSIAADNDRARRLLERCLPGFPQYNFLGSLTTLLIPTKTRRWFDVGFALGPRASRPHPIKRAGRPHSQELESATATELEEFYNRIGSQHHLSTAWTAEALAALAARPFAAANFGVLRRHGQIAAAAALWDQRGFRQTVIRGYSRTLTLGRPVINSLGALSGFPSLPEPGSVLSHAFLSPLACPDDSALLCDLVTAFGQRAAQSRIDLLTLCLPSDDPRLLTLQQRFRCRAYHSRLYRVSWPEETPIALDRRAILPDVAFL